MRNIVTAVFLIVGKFSVAMGAPAEVAERTCRILFVSPVANAPKKAFLTDGASSQEVELPSANLSPVYKLSPGNIILSLFSQNPADLKKLPPGAPSAAVAEGVNDCYLMIASDPTNKVAPFKIQVVDASSTAFRAGQMMWLNISRFEVGGQLGKTNFNVKPNSRAIVNSPVAGYESFPVKIGYSPGAGKPAAPLSSTLWQNDPTARTVIFVLAPPTARFPQICGFVDSRAAKKKEGP